MREAKIEVKFTNAESERLYNQIKDAVEDRANKLIEKGATLKGVMGDPYRRLLMKNLEEIYSIHAVPTFVVRELKRM